MKQEEKNQSGPPSPASGKSTSAQSIDITEMSTFLSKEESFLENLPSLLQASGLHLPDRQRQVFEAVTVFEKTFKGKLEEAAQEYLLSLFAKSYDNKVEVEDEVRGSDGDILKLSGIDGKFVEETIRELRRALSDPKGG
jgi:hypothetical protein